MRHICPISGLEWNSPFITRASPSPIQHPVFSLTYPQLIKALESTLLDNRAEYSSTEFQASHYLLLLACLTKLPTKITAPIRPEPAFPRLLKHQDSLLKAMHFAQRYKHADRIPQLVISKDNNDLSNLAEYLVLVQDAINEHAESAREQARLQRILRKEHTLLRLIGSQSSTGKAMLAKVLPEWADLVCSFPRFTITTNSGKQCTLAEAYKDIIKLSVLGKHHEILTTYTLSDIQELITDCEDSLELGTAYSAALLRTLRISKQVLEEFTAPPIINLDLLDDLSPQISQDRPTPPDSPKASRLHAILAARGLR